MKEKIIVITSYPPKDSLYGKKVGGLASFTKNTIQSMNDNFEFIILAEILDKEEEYKEKSNTIKRIWQKGKFSLYPKLLKQLWQYRKESNQIFLEFEFSIFGGMFVTGFMPFLIIIAKFLGYKTTIVIHQVVEDIRKLAKHLGLKEKTFRLGILNFLLKQFFKLLTFSSEKIIVLDQVHKNKLLQLTKPKKINKIYVIPHGVDQRGVSVERINKIQNIMYFGFITWYKGADWLVKNFDKYCRENPDTNLKLFMVGGESPTQKDNPTYGDFYKEIEDITEKNNKINLTGFIEEEEFDKYFSMADLVILPYRVLMSSSGPLSLAFTYKKPFLMSEKLLEYTLTNDFIEGLNNLNMATKDIIFKLDNPNDLFTRISNLDNVETKKLIDLSTYIKNARSWQSLGQEYLRVLMD